jgi:hypothetical protein
MYRLYSSLSIILDMLKKTYAQSQKPSDLD